MDVNGTRFHLFREEDDWATLREVGVEAGDERSEWSPERDALILRPEVFLFDAVPGAGGAPELPVGDRRGGAADRYGTVYWIGPDRRTVYRLRSGEREAEAYWTPEEDPPAGAARPDAGGGGPSGVGAPDPDPAGFRPVAPPAPAPVRLQGLTVTGNHYLVVGNPPARELRIVDLHSGGPGLRLSWPDGVAFEPWDLDPAPDDGAWVLDRANRTLWLLDRTFGVVPPRPWPGLTPLPERRGTAARPASGFVPVSGDPLPEGPPAFPTGIELDGLDDPASVAGLPDGTVLLLDHPAGGGASALVRVAGEDVVWSRSLEGVVRVAGEASASDIRAYDLAYLPAPAERGRRSGGKAGRRVGSGGSGAKGGEQGYRGSVILAEARGNQAFRLGLTLDPDPAVAPELAEPREYLPLRRYGGAELVVRGGSALYDLEQRWVEIRAVSRPRYERGATRASEALDGREEGCVWHRIILDACIPPSTEVRLAVRAADDPDDLARLPWLQQPRPYLRGDGSELPHHGRFDDEGTDEGSWETLIQEVRGRYLELRIRLEGSGRATPVVRALRIHYPRFSYLHRYLPRIYRDDPEPASFADRLLANFEGLFTTWEGRIVEAHRFFDPHAVPAQELEWLAGWLGVVLDPLWDEDRRRLFLSWAAELYRWRGTPKGIERAVRLYVDPHPDDALFRGRGGGPTAVRVVEHFRTRRTGGGPHGQEDPGSGDVLAPLTRELAEGASHRFTVLVPSDMEPERLDVVRRIVELEKPAHTAFDVQFFWTLFRVGAARVGVDTELGDGLRFRPAVWGDAELGEVDHLGAGYPFDVPVRIVADRDAYGDAPPL